MYLKNTITILIINFLNWITQFFKMKSNIKKIAIIGLGYVGLPLAIEFGKKRLVIGFDIDNNSCIIALNKSNEIHFFYLY